MMRYIDDHCHLPHGVDADPVVEAAQQAGVERLITVGTDPVSSTAAIDTARRHPGVVFATAGIHPHDAKDGLDGIPALLVEPEVVAVGECGLDYHYDHSPRDVQRDIFEAQIALAHDHDLALVIHTREAWDDTFAILDSAGVPGRTVFHCFTGGPDDAERALALGAYLSFSGIVTFPDADDLRAAARVCPLERVLVETDSPYLAPVPHRGRRNQPAWVVDVAAGVAAAKSVEVAEIARASWDNASRAYALDPS